MGCTGQRVIMRSCLRRERWPDALGREWLALSGRLQQCTMLRYSECHNGALVLRPPYRPLFSVASAFGEACPTRNQAAPNWLSHSRSTIHGTCATSISPRTYLAIFHLPLFILLNRIVSSSFCVLLLAAPFTLVNTRFWSRRLAWLLIGQLDAVFGQPDTTTWRTRRTLRRIFSPTCTCRS